MWLRIICLSLVVVFIGETHAQEGEVRPGLELVTFGPNYQNTTSSLAIERYSQTRTALISIPVNDRFNIQTGITHTRIDNRDVLELPLLLDYQVTNKIHVFSGPTIRVNYPLQATEENVSIDNGVFMSMGSGYRLAPNWDASIQFVLPIIEGTNFESGSLEAPQPIRMRTGWKF